MVLPNIDSVQYWLQPGRIPVSIHDMVRAMHGHPCSLKLDIELNKRQGHRHHVRNQAADCQRQHKRQHCY